LRNTPRELLPVDLAVAFDVSRQPLGEGVDDGDAHTVQAAGDLVALTAELRAGMQLRQDDLERGDTLPGKPVDGDAAATVTDRHRVVGVNRDLDRVVEARESFVDRVVETS